MSEVAPDIRALGSQSRRTALLTFLSLALVLGSILYSIYSLRTLEQSKEVLSVELKQLEMSSVDLLAKNNKLQRTNGELQLTNDQLESKRKDTEKKIEKLEKRYAGLKTAVERAELTVRTSTESAAATLKVFDQRIFEIQSSAVPTGRTLNSGAEYRFSLFINGNAEALNGIEKVTYFFDHPSFPAASRTKISMDREQRFSVGYNGWGCMDPVIITVDFKDGRQSKTDFNMCKNLGWK